MLIVKRLYTLLNPPSREDFPAQTKMLFQVFPLREMPIGKGSSRKRSAI
jgi:hypothetical protein